MHIIAVVRVLLVFWVSLSRGQDACNEQDWSTTFATATWNSMSQCRDNVSYVSGLTSQDYGFQNGPSIIKKATCCNVKPPYSQEGNDCYWEDWSKVLTSYGDEWVTCERKGYFVHGFLTLGASFLYNIGRAQCCKPDSHPEQDVGCRKIDVDFTVDGAKMCADDTFLKGIHRTGVGYTMAILNQIQCCAMRPGRLDGAWSEWTTWNACTLPCGGGTQQRNRSCSNPAPQAGGSPCPGTERRQTQACNIDPCPVNGGWTPWSLWDTCTVQCGSGSQGRTRACTSPPPSGGGNPCSGDASQRQVCNTQPCSPVDGGWSLYSSWSACDKNCGGGVERKTRTCTNPPPANQGKDCVGSDTKTKVCNKQGCQFNQWSAWGACSVTCGGGKKKRTRTCKSKPPCGGNTEQERNCGNRNCP